MLKTINSNHITNIAKYQLIEIFNTRFYNNEYYQSHKGGLMQLDYETNRVIKQFIFEDVLDFCLKTDVCKSLHMSFLEIMSLDLASYTTLKEIIQKENERKAIALEKSRKDSEDRTKQLIGAR